MSHGLEHICHYLHLVCESLKLDAKKLEYGFLCSGNSEVDHMVVLDSIESHEELEDCEKCQISNELGLVYHFYFHTQACMKVQTDKIIYSVRIVISIVQLHNICN